MADILIIDDDPRLRQSFAKLLTSEGHTARQAPSGEAGLELMRERLPDMAVVDLRLPGMNGLETYQFMREIEPRMPVVIMTAYGTTETAIEATKLGAYDYVLKPFDIPVFLKLIENALQASKFMRGRVEINCNPDEQCDQALLGRSPSMQELFKSIGRVAPTDATVLIRGDSGTGKELIARAVYQHSLRAHKPFMVINCVAIPETLLESELFGYEKGAFTGANNRRIGKVEQANSGTVFLDEIGDMPLSIQSKILRLLQEKQVQRLGGLETINVDVRILAATNRDLEAAVADGRFREDLYYRLKVVALHSPPLRERGDDIRLLAEYFLAQHAKTVGMNNPGLAPEALDLLSAYPWPGNVRELANCLHKAVIFSRGGPIRGEEMAAILEGPERATRTLSGADALEQWVLTALNRHAGDNALETITDHVASMTVRLALTATGGNRTRAAKLLGISRPTLVAKISKYDLRIDARIT
ncbi:MAG: sigma-54 dependent transcriptional regulator [Proteobacteria bacterium]|nr:sigma-54 dependent transcriptional regulator [Pseudomonadota bacterium]MBU1611634.1 sigma-54 dependent transcriptional regulator [Pseudomonadota bacterium]